MNDELSRYVVPPKVCATECCERSFRPHYWGSVNASRDGWFVKKDGTAWCPDHVPAWVEAWRNRED